MSQPLRDLSAEPTSLRATSEAYHARLVPHVDRLLTMAEMVGRVDCAALHALYNEEYAFIAQEFVPHMDAVERVLYGHLETLMEPRHTMAPMREEHDTVRSLVAELGSYQVHADECTWNEMEGLALRRSLYRLHALLKVHLAEEAQYLAVLDRGLSDVEKVALVRDLDPLAQELDELALEVVPPDPVRSP